MKKCSTIFMYILHQKGTKTQKISLMLFFNIVWNQIWSRQLHLWLVKFSSTAFQKFWGKRDIHFHQNNDSWKVEILDNNASEEQQISWARCKSI